MLQQVDLISAATPASALATITLLIMTAKLHGLFGTGLSFWILIASGSMAMFALSSCLYAISPAADAIADISLIAAGFSAYAASRWLRGRFALGAGHGR